jgi:hypothetical protein
VLPGDVADVAADRLEAVLKENPELDLVPVVGDITSAAMARPAAVWRGLVSHLRIGADNWLAWYPSGHARRWK